MVQRTLALIVMTQSVIMGMLPSASATKFESAFGFGPAFYSGDTTSNLIPAYSMQINYSANAVINNYVAWPNRFDFGVLVTGSNLANQGINYNGVAGTYSTGVQINLAKGSVLPFVEAGGALSVFALLTTNGPSTVSKNQTSLKYGYYIATGFDRLAGKGRGSAGGWGISLSYFQFLKSASGFEFTSGPVTVEGVRMDFRFIMGGSSKK